jgi:hypothetical protein
MSRISRNLTDLALHKARLVERAAAQRAAIRQTFARLQGPIALADGAMSIGRFLRAHPVLVGAAVAALVVLRGRGGVLSIAGRAISVWRLWRWASAWVSGRLA